MTKILVVENEEGILMPLQDDLEQEGYKVESARDGESGLRKAVETEYDLIILDVMFPGGPDGFEVCRQLRKAEVATPVIMLTAKSQEVDRVLGLELGADDYVVKPFSTRELLARVKAVLRRSRVAESGVTQARIGDVEVDFKQYVATRDGQPLLLTALEFALLHLLVQHRNEVLSRDRILDEVWGEDVYVTPRTVDTHIANLRKKLEPDPSKPRFLLGVRGVGYKLAL